MSLKKLLSSKLIIIMVFLTFGSNVYANSPTDSVGIHTCGNYTYAQSLYNCQADGSYTKINISFGNTSQLDFNEIFYTLMYIENDHSSNEYSYFFRTSFDSSYVDFEDVYYGASDVTDNIVINGTFNSNGIVDLYFYFGDPALGQGILSPDEKIQAWIDWQYKGDDEDAYWWLPKVNFRGANYHFLSGRSAPSTEAFPGTVPEVGTSGNIHLLGSGLNYDWAMGEMKSGIDDDLHKEWNEIQLRKKKGLFNEGDHKFIIRNSNDEIVLETTLSYYKEHKDEIMKKYNLLPQN